jgi:hypothetical protein
MKRLFATSIVESLEETKESITVESVASFGGAEVTEGRIIRSPRDLKSVGGLSTWRFVVQSDLRFVCAC